MKIYCTFVFSIKKMDKIKFRINRGSIDFSAENGKSTKIYDVITFLENKQKEGATDIEWGGYTFDGSIEEVTIETFFMREETDEEYQKRVALENERQEIINRNKVEKEIELYNSLKKKYEGRQS